MYEEQKILHTVRHDGKVIVIENVPAEVCDTCGDILLSGDTIRRLERILSDNDLSKKPPKQAPVYSYASP